MSEDTFPDCTGRYCWAGQNLSDGQHFTLISRKCWCAGSLRVLCSICEWVFITNKLFILKSTPGSSMFSQRAAWRCSPTPLISFTEEDFRWCVMAVAWWILQKRKTLARLALSHRLGTHFHAEVRLSVPASYVGFSSTALRCPSSRSWRLTNQWNGSRPWLLDLMSR